jgi:hypothetical protein
VSFLPIVERELRVVARKAGTFRVRIFVAVLTSLGAAVMLLASAASPSPRIGSVIFTTLGALAFLFCLFEGGRNAADCLTEEKREETLGLLFLTDLRGYDVVLGKLAAFSLNN